MNAKKFRNFSDEDFTWKWDGVSYTFPAGQETYLEDYKADHFAKHLVDREMGKAKIQIDRQVERNEFTAKCFPASEEVTPAQALNLNEEVKAKKGKKKVEEFPDLKN